MVACTAVAAVAPEVDFWVLRSLVFLPWLVPPLVLATALLFLVPLLLELVLGKVLGLGLQVLVVDVGPDQCVAHGLGCALELSCSGQVGA